MAPLLSQEGVGGGQRKNPAFPGASLDRRHGHPRPYESIMQPRWRRGILHGSPPGSGGGWGVVSGRILFSPAPPLTADTVTRALTSPSCSQDSGQRFSCCR